MTVKEFYIQNKKIFPFITSGVIGFYGKKTVIDQGVGRKGTLYLSKHEQDSFLDTEHFDHYFDLVPYNDYVIKQYSIQKFVTFPFDNLIMNVLRCLLFCMFMGKDLISKKL